jgi:hypothetical protein
MFLRMPGVNRQGQAHIVSTAIVSPGSGKGVWEGSQVADQWKTMLETMALLSAFGELALQVLTVRFYLESIRADW